MYTIQELINFEKDIEEIYKTGIIRGPIHLRNGNEQILIDIFKKISKNDYVFATWSNHLEALLHGIPKQKVKDKILRGESIALSFPEYRFFCSAIVGGICPISLGVALALKKENRPEKVWCFIGDMTAMGGVANECIRYADNHDLPITFVIGDNDKSVGTDTEEVWGESCEDYIIKLNNRKVIYYKYNLNFPHSGVGQFISF